MLDRTDKAERYWNLMLRHHDLAEQAELPFLRDLWGALNSAQTSAIFRDTLIPAFFLLTGLFVPDNIQNNYRSL